MLDQIGVDRNWWTIDVGCGPLGILDLLADSTGPGAEVIGLERDPNMLEFGHELMAERGLDQVRLIQGDAHDTGLPSSSFDLAHSRLLLVNVPIRWASCRNGENHSPGRMGRARRGRLDFMVCEPMHPAWNRLLSINAEFGTARNGRVRRPQTSAPADAGRADGRSVQVHAGAPQHR
jgi:SAM-dependent methyltransferase